MQRDLVPSINLVQVVDNFFTGPRVIGPLNEGRFVPIAAGGVGFYVPFAIYDECQRIANETRQTQFLTVDADGNAIHASRDECLARGFGGVAWITPQKLP